jgi:hypothetical protein
MGRMKFENVVVLPRRVVAQPKPAIVKGGDCGACVIGGLLGVSVKEVYALRTREPKAFSHYDMYHALKDAMGRGALDRFISDAPTWVGPSSKRCFGDASWENALKWFDWVRMGLDGGYYGIMNYNFKGCGPGSDPDHVVLVVGARRVRVELKNAAFRLDNQLLISCSSTVTEPEFWIDVRKLLMVHGGYNLFLARPSSP